MPRISTSGHHAVHDAVLLDLSLRHFQVREISASHVISSVEKMGFVTNSCSNGYKVKIFFLSMSFEIISIWICVVYMAISCLPFLGLPFPPLATDAESTSTTNATMNTNITDAGNSNTGGIRHRRLLPVRNSHLAIVMFKVTFLRLTQLMWVVHCGASPLSGW